MSIMPICPSLYKGMICIYILYLYVLQHKPPGVTIFQVPRGCLKRRLEIRQLDPGIPRHGSLEDSYMFSRKS